MKKGTVFLVALFAAAITHAAIYIEWEITGGPPNSYPIIKNHDGGAFEDGWEIYLILSGNKDSITTAIENGSSVADVKALTLDYALLSSLGLPDGSRPQEATSPLFVNNTLYDFTIFLFNEEYTGNPGSSGWYYFSETRSGFVYDEAPGTVTFGWVDFPNGTWLPYAFPIPEPTAMALLALGVAAVGLRRRFRK